MDFKPSVLEGGGIRVTACPCKSGEWEGRVAVLLTDLPDWKSISKCSLPYHPW